MSFFEVLPQFVFVIIHLFDSINCNTILARVIINSLLFQETPDSAVLGAAYQAKHGFLGEAGDYNKLTSSLHPPHLVCEPYKDAAEIYEPMVARYRSIVQTLLNEKH